MLKLVYIRYFATLPSCQGTSHPSKRGWIRGKRGNLSEEDKRDKAVDRLARGPDVVQLGKADGVSECTHIPHKKCRDERAFLRHELLSTEVPLIVRKGLIIKRKWCEQIFDHGKTCATVVAPSHQLFTTAATRAHSTANTNTVNFTRHP